MGKKWHNNSVYKLNAMLGERQAIGASMNTVVRALTEQMLQRESEAKAELCRVLSITHPRLTLTPDAVSFGYWECEDSPTKNCIYNSHRDPSLDHCLFCDEPAERSS